MTDYHSAHDAEAADAPALDSFRVGDSVAFHYDLRDGLPTDYRDCDLLYADLPWSRGAATFNARAGVEQGHHGFMTAVSDTVRAVNQPMVLVTGKHALPMLPSPTWVCPVRLNRHDAIAIMYRLYPRGGAIPDTATRLLESLASEFSRVGDFCCGYGRTLRTFYDAGKSFVGSDYNPRCIGRVAQLFSQESASVPA